VDLDEIDLLAKKHFLFSRNKFNFFSFRDNEHLQLPADKPDTTKTTKEHILDYLRSNNLTASVKRIMILTNMNVLGYNFNPVSFYYCYGQDDEVFCVVAEIGNTFGEIKPYLLGPETRTGDAFHLNTTKYFYVSPFIDHDVNFDFNISVPSEKLNIRIDDMKEDQRFFISTLTGTRKLFSGKNLLYYGLRFPFITLKIITLIHWNALLLYLKKIPFHRKAANQDLQRNVYRRKSS
jgi:DUF1365 family protein